MFDFESLGVKKKSIVNKDATTFSLFCIEFAKINATKIKWKMRGGGVSIQIYDQSFTNVN